MDASGSSPDRPAKTAPPYVSFITFKNCIQDLKEHGLPNKIDRSVLRKFSGITGTQLMTALRFLNLMDATGRPTDHLIGLVTAYGTDSWPQRLKPVLEAAYAPIFAINLDTATPNEFSATFSKAFPGADSVLKRCEAFFLPAATDAGIQISKRILTGRKPRQAGVTPLKRRQTPKPAAVGNAAPLVEDDHPAASRAARELKAQLLAKFPTFDPNWPDTIKAEWFKGFQQFMAMTKEGDTQ